MFYYLFYFCALVFAGVACYISAGSSGKFLLGIVATGAIFYIIMRLLKIADKIQAEEYRKKRESDDSNEVL